MPQLETTPFQTEVVERCQQHRIVGLPAAGLGRWLVMGLLLCTFVLSACEDPRFGHSVRAENGTDSVLTFAAVVDGELSPISGRAEPGETVIILGGLRFGGPSVIIEGDCTKVDVVALDPDGREVARRPPPLCLDDVWVIEGD
jgi:hypothetical protein